MLSTLEQYSTEAQRTRDCHNKRQHWDRLKRELAAQGFSTLPQELLFRTHQVWDAPSGMAMNFADRSDKTAADNVAQADDAGGLAFHRPPPPPILPLVPCELIGSVILGRPWEPFLIRYNAERAKQLIADLRRERVQDVRRDWLAARLAERIELRPIVPKSDWSDVEETIGAEGLTEYSITASYEGDGRLWPAGPCAKPYKRVLRPILDAPMSIGVENGAPIGVQKRPPSSCSMTGMVGTPFALVAAEGGRSPTGGATSAKRLLPWVPGVSFGA